MQKQIDKFGLIGKDISYSFSKKFFSRKFINEGLNNCSYENYDISSISELLEVINDTKIKGLNVTIPYKESVIELLNHIDPIAKKIGAVNTIKIDKQNKLLGYNTDYIGFKQSLESNISNQKRALGIVECDPELKAKSAKTAMLFSRTNTLLSLPMLLTMVAAQNLY